MFDGVYAGRRVLVTGHTGFLGGWATRWLVQLGAEVAGYSRGGGGSSGPSADPLRPYRGDITDQVALTAAIHDFAPAVIVHLAGSTTVQAGFRSPMDTFAANVTGTSTVLHAALRQPSVRAVVVTGTPAVATLDDTLELNPYAASKAAVETVVAAYAHPRTQHSAGRTDALAVGIARPGVMVGGDWSEGRLLADVARSVRDGDAVVLRAPAAVRPWQHVLEGVGGTLLLGARLATGAAPRRRYDFGRLGPDEGEPVQEVVHRFLAAFGVPDWPVRIEGAGGDRITLGADAAVAELGWRPVWSLDQALRATAGWYAATDPVRIGEEMDQAIRDYSESALSRWQRTEVSA